MTPDTPACATCAMFAPVVFDSGECRASPPIVLKRGTEFPQVATDDWCGHWRAKPVTAIQVGPDGLSTRAHNVMTNECGGPDGLADIINNGGIPELLRLPNCGPKTTVELLGYALAQGNITDDAITRLEVHEPFLRNARRWAQEHGAAPSDAADVSPGHRHADHA